jgi:hypothetical protein
MLVRSCRLCGENFHAGADANYCSGAHRQQAYRNRHKPPASPTMAVPVTVEEKLALIARLVAEVRELTGCHAVTTNCSLTGLRPARSCPMTNRRAEAAQRLGHP